jgi:hypothetical protein
MYIKIGKSYKSSYMQSYKKINKTTTKMLKNGSVKRRGTPQNKIKFMNFEIPNE